MKGGNYRIIPQCYSDTVLHGNRQGLTKLTELSRTAAAIKNHGLVYSTSGSQERTSVVQKPQTASNENYC